MLQLAFYPSWKSNQTLCKSSRGNYLSSRKVANSASVLNPSRSRRSLHLCIATPMFTLVLCRALSNSFFCAFFSSGFLFLLVYAVVGNGGIGSCFLLMVVAPSLLSLDRAELRRKGAGTVCSLWMSSDWQLSRQSIKHHPGSDWFLLPGRGGFWQLAVGAVGGT